MNTQKLKLLPLVFLAVTVIVGAMTGCGSDGKKEALSSEELDFFNGDEFFNGEYMNIRNQFLSSLYDEPKKIDLFGLFYIGTDDESATEEELDAVISQNGWDQAPDTGCTKISKTKIDEILTEYADITLSETEKIGLDKFTYLAEYDAYYLYHGDTNYRAEICFSKGEREGDVIRLFYEDSFFNDAEKVLTLKEDDNGFLFISNMNVADIQYP